MSPSAQVFSSINGLSDARSVTKGSLSDRRNSPSLKELLFLLKEGMTA